MKKDDEFKFNYSAPTAGERKQVESIRRIYAPQDETNSEKQRLLHLNKKVHSLPTALSVIIGVVGLLILGLGMTAAMEWNSLILGITIGVIGTAIMAIAYPIYRLLFKKLKAKYSGEILALCDSILGKEEDSERSAADNHSSETKN